MAAESHGEQVRELAQSATDAAQQAAARQKDSLASSLGDFAGALRDAARQSGADRQKAGPIAEWAADGLERVSTALRSQDLRSMLHTVEVFARRQPVAFFCAAAAAGFLATRFIKAGADTSAEQSERDDVPSVDPAADSSDFPPMNPA